MGYYRGSGDCMYGRGDYYRGDYYRGDPGLLGSLFGGIKSIAKAAIAATPVGAAIGAVLSKPSPVRGTAIAPFAQQPRDIGIRVGGPSGFQFGAFAPEGPQLPQVPGGTQVMIPGMGLCTIRGTHANKSTYVTRGGGTSRWPQGVMVHPKGTTCVKNRRINVANPRALRRAIRRAQGFAKLARRVLSFTGARVRGKTRFKIGRRRKAA
jgi:hypothetical protein